MVRLSERNKMMKKSREGGEEVGLKVGNFPPVFDAPFAPKLHLVNSLCFLAKRNLLFIPESRNGCLDFNLFQEVAIWCCSQPCLERAD